MKERWLATGLLAEGPSDAHYLGALVRRQLRDTVLRSAGNVRVAECEPCTRYITGTGDSALVDAALLDLALDCDLVFVHSDDKERGKARARVAALREGSEGIPQHRRAEPVTLITVRMVESWMLADRSAVRRAVPGADLSKYPYRSPAEVEKANNDPQHDLYAKTVWKAVVGPGRESSPVESMVSLAEHTDLRTLAQLPSYQQWLSDTEAALKLKGFL